MFGRKKKNADQEASIAGLPAANVSIVPSSETTVTPITSVGPPEQSVAPPEQSVGPPEQSPGSPGQSGVTYTFDSGSNPLLKTHATVRIDGGATVIDARNVPGLRQEILDVMSHGGNPAEIQDIVMKAMSQGHAVTGMPPMTGGEIAPPSTPAEEDPLDKLQRLNDLRVRGALTDAEFEAQKKKILGEM